MHVRLIVNEAGTIISVMAEGTPSQGSAAGEPFACPGQILEVDVSEALFSTHSPAGSYGGASRRQSPDRRNPPWRLPASLTGK